MRFRRDLTDPRLIHAKGILFVALGFLSAGLLLAEMRSLKSAVLLVIAVWAFCRFYYYLFYVLERYLGRGKRFAGVLDALSYLLRSRS